MMVTAAAVTTSTRNKKKANGVATQKTANGVATHKTANGLATHKSLNLLQWPK